MLTSFTQKVTYVTIIAGLLCLSAAAQTRPFTQVYSENIKGGTVLFGNTSMHIVDNNVVNTAKMNGLANPTTGLTTYGNDNENMMFADVDTDPADLGLFNAGASGWKYLANGSNQNTAWRTLNNPGSPWTAGTAGFGYGYTQTTTITSGHVTAYFLKNVTVTDPTKVASFDFVYSYDDGIVIYVNGVEVKRANMPTGTIAYNTAASNNDSTKNATLSIAPGYFSAGNNIIAVEVHQNTASSTDCYFDMSLTAIGLKTKNSSSANLILPAGTNTIKFARLYFGGRINKSVVTAAPDTLRKIKIRKGTSGDYSAAIAPASNVNIFSLSNSEEVYQTFVDVTAFMQAGGAGTYTVADLPASTGAVSSGGHYGGWALAVAYENAASDYTSVRIYDGYSQVFVNSNTTVADTITLTGLNVPNNPLSASDAVMATMVWEGDGNLGYSTSNPAGDYLKVNNSTVSNAVNPATNFWNGTISKNGAFVSGTKNPDYFNQMGIDIDEINVGTLNIQPNATSVTIEFGTEADQYFPSVFTFAIKMKDPVITLDKTVKDANNDDFVDANEILTYTLSGTNMGPGVAYNATIIDSLPTNVTYVANSLEVVSAPGCTAGVKTDAVDADNAMKGNNAGRDYIKFFIGNGWTNASGGQLPIGSTYELKFKVQAQAIPGSITNTARITANSQSGDQFIDDGTAVIAPSGGPVDVRLTSFIAKRDGGNGLLTWVTESEVNSDYFEIERSDDGINFVKRGIVHSAGTSSTKITYNFTDPLNTTSQVVYYRLKMFDIGGKYNFSKIIAIRLSGTISTQGFSVYPNPFISDIKVKLTSTEDVMSTFRVLSFDGKELLTRKISVQKGENIVVLKDFGTIPRGNYILEVTTATDKFISKIIKE